MATRLGTRSEWLAAHPVPLERLTQTLVVVANRTLDGESFNRSVRDFLDEFALAGDEDWRTRSIADRPRATGDARGDAYLGALAEHLATVHDLTRPAWSIEPDRFLERFWFVSDIRGFRAVSIAQAPAAFRRRGIFLPERSLHTV